MRGEAEGRDSSAREENNFYPAVTEKAEGEARKDEKEAVKDGAASTASGDLTNPQQIVEGEEKAAG